MERRRRRERRRSGNRPLRLAWLLLLLLVAAVGFYVKAPAAWLAALGLDRGPGATAVAVGQLPPLPPGSEIAAATTPTWQINRAPPVAATADKPLVAVVLVGLGRSATATDVAISLPAPLSLAFSPYARPFAEVAERARLAGHEILVDLPMEGEGEEPDPGPGALLTLLDVPQNLERLEAILGQGEPLAGVVVLGGERFLAATDLVEPVMARLRERGMMVVLPRIEGVDAGSGDGTALLLVDRRLYAAASTDELLAEVERIALTTGSAVAVVPAEAPVLAEIGPWAASLAARGFVLAPATQVLERRLTGS
ncbi:MAG TPA: divergent polysaccharide deacetylase family protein [Kiloniellales bacterium]|nr:divergent polysaccharide deacetylase family protein [Kiloniellales bacterium]